MKVQIPHDSRISAIGPRLLWTQLRALISTSMDIDDTNPFNDSSMIVLRVNVQGSSESEFSAEGLISVNIRRGYVGDGVSNRVGQLSYDDDMNVTEKLNNLNVTDIIPLTQETQVESSVPLLSLYQNYPNLRFTPIELINVDVGANITNYDALIITDAFVDSPSDQDQNGKSFGNVEHLTFEGVQVKDDVALRKTERLEALWPRILALKIQKSGITLPVRIIQASAKGYTFGSGVVDIDLINNNPFTALSVLDKSELRGLKTITKIVYNAVLYNSDSKRITFFQYSLT